MNPDTSSDANRPCMIPIDFNEEIIAAAAAMLPAEYRENSKGGLPPAYQTNKRPAPQIRSQQPES